MTEPPSPDRNAGLPLIDVHEVGCEVLLRNALRDIGAFRVELGEHQHGSIDACRRAATTFFRQPEDAKLRSRQPDWRVFAGYVPMLAEGRLVDGEWEGGDLKASFCLGPPGARHDELWPPIVGFRSALLRYCEVLGEICHEIRAAIALGLTGSTEHFETAFETPANMLKLNWYPALGGRPSDRLRSAPHTDFEFFTLLWQDMGPDGLQVRDRNGAWLDVRPTAGSLIVLVGDLLQMWTNGAARACPHRVVAPSDAADARRSRLSIAYFHQPAPDALVPRFDEEQGHDVTAGDYLNDRLVKG